VFIKVCGITRLPDALCALQGGATALGFIFWPASPRCVSAEQARTIVAGLPGGVTTVGVFVNESVEIVRQTLAFAGVDAVQLHGDEPASYGTSLGWPLFKAISQAGAERALAEWPVQTTFLIDTHDPVRRGGTGVTTDWSRAAALARRHRLVLAGGLTPANVADAIAQVQPFGVDVSSGVETSPGIKDPAKMTQFLVNARAAFASRARRHGLEANSVGSVRLQADEGSVRDDD
jgi:phosphoribosylanthranilate isomerase